MYIIIFFRNPVEVQNHTVSPEYRWGPKMRAARTPGKRAARYLKGDVFTGTFENNLKTGLGRITHDPQRSVMLSSGQSWRAIGPSCFNKLHPLTAEKRWETGRVSNLSLQIVVYTGCPGFQRPFQSMAAFAWSVLRPLVQPARYKKGGYYHGHFKEGKRHGEAEQPRVVSRCQKAVWELCGVFVASKSQHFPAHEIWRQSRVKTGIGSNAFG